MNLSLKSSLFLIAILFAANLTFISCKDENNDPVNPSKPLLASMSSSSKDGKMYETSGFLYDSNRRLIEVNTSDRYKTIFEYSPSQVIVKSYYKDSLEETPILHLDNKGLCTSTIWYENFTTDYTYDENGYRKTSVEKEGNSTITQTFTVSNENYVTVVQQDVYANWESVLVNKSAFFGKLNMMKSAPKEITGQNSLKSAQNQIYNYKTDFEFYTDKTNTIDVENMGMTFFGKQNKNPIKQETGTSDNSPASTSTYTYEYDSKGRITKQTFNNGDYDVFTYVD